MSQLTETNDVEYAASVAYVPRELADAYWIPEEPPTDMVDGEGPELSRYTFAATRKSSHGQLTVIDTEVPAGNGPPQHLHHDADESFFGLDGEFWFEADGSEFMLRPGDFAFVRRGTPHIWKNRSDEPARMLRIYTPGGHEDFFFQVGERVQGDEAPPRLTTAMADRAEAIATATYGPREAS